MQSYVDFFYITNNTTPSYITASEAYIHEKELKRKEKAEFDHTPERLTQLRDDLCSGEDEMRSQKYASAFKIYTRLAN